MEAPPKTGLADVVATVFWKLPFVRVEFTVGLQFEYAILIISLISCIMGEDATAAVLGRKVVSACLCSSREDLDTANATVPIMP
jgi:hypothetical protein